MSISQQVVSKLDITLLKNLRDFEITFKTDGLTGILGTNGSGKSTLLHALACVYQPNEGQDSENYKFSQFFIPTNHSLWTGSRFTMTHDFRDNTNFNPNEKTTYTKQADRWAPKYSRRPKRYVSFIGIKSCVPVIELESQSSRITFNTIRLNEQLSMRLLDLGGKVMNRNYEALNTHISTKQKKYLGLDHRGISYSSLNMGAGEQRIFQLIGEVLKCPNYSLILIDEIDLLMHEDALIRLLNILKTLSIDKHLQIIFTTHNHRILNVSDIEFRHIQQTETKTVCYSNTNTEALFRLTGRQIKTYELFAEDTLTRFILKQVAHEKGVARETTIIEFGAASNCFTSVSGAILNETPNIENMIFVLDGDVYRNEEEKRTQINKVLTGNIGQFQEKRNLAISKIRQLNLPEGISPERYYRNIIVNLNEDNLTPKQLELKNILADIENPPDDHKFIGILLNRIGLEEGEILTLISDMLRLTPEWEELIRDIDNWFNERISENQG